MKIKFTSVWMKYETGLLSIKILRYDYVGVLTIFELCIAGWYFSIDMVAKDIYDTDK
jgi:hypothetical protein